MSSCTRISTSVRSSPPRALYIFVRLYSASLQDLPKVLLVLAPQGFVLLRTSVRCASQRPLWGASLQRLCASVYCTSSKSFVRCEPTKALYSVRQGLCFCVLYEPQELCAVRAYKGFVLLCTVRAPRALRGASLQRLCASVCCTSPTSIVRCEPTKALYRQCALYEPHELCAARAYKGFVPLCAVRAPRAFFGANLQRLYTVCARACASGTVRASRALCGASLQRLYTVCTVRASRALCGASLQRLYTVCGAKPTKALYSVLVFALQALHRVLMCPCGRMSR